MSYEPFAQKKAKKAYKMTCVVLGPVGVLQNGCLSVGRKLGLVPVKAPRRE